MCIRDRFRALEHFFRIPQYLLRMMECYLSDRVEIYDKTDGPRRTKIAAWAVQNLILGSDLLNVSYDGILRIEMAPDTFLVGYADDVVVVSCSTEH